MRTLDYTTKTRKAIDAFKKQDLKGALRIFKGFDKQFDKNEIRTLQIAYEVLTGKGRFYRQLGINIGHMVVESISIIENRYNIAY